MFFSTTPTYELHNFKNLTNVLGQIFFKRNKNSSLFIFRLKLNVKLWTPDCIVQVCTYLISKGLIFSKAWQHVIEKFHQITLCLNIASLILCVIDGDLTRHMKDLRGPLVTIFQTVSRDMTWWKQEKKADPLKIGL